MVRAMVGTRVNPQKMYPSCLPLKLFICIDGNSHKKQNNDPHIMQNCPYHNLHGKLVTKRANAS